MASPGWPYDDLYPPEPLGSMPSWDCPEGTCACPGAAEEETHEIAVMLCDEHGRRMGGARCRVTQPGYLDDGEPLVADDDGWLIVLVEGHVQQLMIAWAPADTPLLDELPHRRRYHVDLQIRPHGDRSEEVRRRLHNLGFSELPTLRQNIAFFQHHYGLRVSGEVQDVLPFVSLFHDQAQVPQTDPDGAQPPLPSSTFAGAATAAGSDHGAQPRPLPAGPPSIAPSQGQPRCGGGPPLGQGTLQPDQQRLLRIRLFDRLAHPLPGAPFRATFGDHRVTSNADSSGHAIVYHATGYETCLLEWGDGSGSGEGETPAYAYRQQIFVRCSRGHSEQRIRERLANLGYAPAAELREQVRAFQREHGITPADGDHNHPATRRRLLDIHTWMTPASRLTEPAHISLYDEEVGHIDNEEAGHIDNGGAA